MRIYSVYIRWIEMKVWMREEVRNDPIFIDRSADGPAGENPSMNTKCDDEGGIAK